MIYFYYFIGFNLVIYFTTILLFIIALLKKSKVNHTKINISGVSVIICVKDGEASISNLINDLKKQTSEIHSEFIIVDDMSTDQTKKNILENIKTDSKFKYITSELGNNNLSHKKKALDAGIKISKYDYLLFTDADCRLNNKWIDSMIHNYQKSTDYVIGCSIITQPKTLASYFQMIDYYMLMISSYAACKLGFPLACTGQNQSYKKQLYQSIDGFNKIKQLLQGDDSIFLQLLKNKNKLNVTFSINQDSYVESKPHHNWKDLILQRIRWAGDANIMWKYNKLFYMVIVSTFLSNLFLIISPFLLPNYIQLISIIFLFKFLFEFFLYVLGLKKINKKVNFIHFLYWFILQIPYVVLMGFLSFFSPMISWRGRSLT